MSEQHRKEHQPWWRKKKSAQKRAEPQPKGNYAFIDSQNLNLGVQKNGWKMDWRKFREWLREAHGVTKAYMFIGYLPDNEALYEQMYEHGFLVVLKPTLEIRQVKPEVQPVPPPEGSDAAAGATRPKPGEKEVKKTEEADKPGVKGNIDADLVLYAMKEIPHYDKAVIVSGDGDFFSLVEYLAQEKKLHKLLVPNRRYSTLLQDFESYIEGIDQHRGELAYHDYHRGKRKARR